ncbi:MAG: Crp/Fnr family transcriptional regulator [Alphaproteobacteria bacterium]|nr:MAG: Crp/Fnr family transcriptional regulator [Alphaproteobacteria bacterium]
MESLLTLAASHPSRTFAAGEILIGQGYQGGDLYILEQGQLAVERDGVRIATIATPGSLIGEMSVVLGTANSATVQAEKPTTVRVIRDARQYLKTDPELTFRVAWLMANRLDATSAYLVQLTKDHAGKPEGGLLGRILSSLNSTDDKRYATVSRGDMFGNTPNG